MGPPGDSGSDVVAHIGGRAITIDALIDLLLRHRQLTTAAGGGEYLLRFFEDRAETVPMPHPYPGLPLCGMSDVPAAGMVVSIRHDTDRADGTFVAHAVTPGGINVVFVGKSTGPLKVVPAGLQHFPLMHLLMSRIVWGNPLPAACSPPISEWLLRVALNDVAAALDQHQIPDGREEALHVEQMLRVSLSRLITAVRDAADTTTRPAPISAEWPQLSASFAIVDGLDWGDLDAGMLAEARGYHSDLGIWLAARGIASLELLAAPDVEEALDRIEFERPIVASLLRRAVEAFAQRFSEVADLSSSHAYRHWRADDPNLLLRLVRKTVADPAFRSVRH
ncbi:hypothetical protein C5U48_10215 [Mycolicibacter virginiensis]|uniref:Uncharacterized protein n=1 Tax=Mycolicibacter virginiensis TaxID=1795032 RepID=A0A9X7INM7_9MYCO|nr:hypothetical protein C5U48_10215 [Mycolicibacter virginiensis]